MRTFKKKLYSRSLLFIAKMISENYLNQKRALVMQKRTKEIFSKELKQQALLLLSSNQNHSPFYHLFILSKHLLSAMQISTLTSAALWYQLTLYTWHNFNTALSWFLLWRPLILEDFFLIHWHNKLIHSVTFSLMAVEMLATVRLLKCWAWCL